MTSLKKIYCIHQIYLENLLTISGLQIGLSRTSRYLLPSIRHDIDKTKVEKIYTCHPEVDIMYSVSTLVIKFHNHSNVIGCYKEHRNIGVFPRE